MKASDLMVESVDELPGLLSKCLDDGGVHLVDLPIDDSENDRIPNQELPERSKAL